MALAALVFVFGGITARPVSAQEPAAATGPPAATNSGFPYVQTSSGCVAGAVLGSVVPGFGTALGCLVGGLVGWWRA